MKPKEPIDTGQHELFRSRLDQILDMRHAKVVLSGKIDWDFLAERCGENYSDKPGHPALSTRFPIGICYAIACRAMNGRPSHPQIHR